MLGLSDKTPPGPQAILKLRPSSSVDYKDLRHYVNVITSLILLLLLLNANRFQLFFHTERPVIFSHLFASFLQLCGQHFKVFISG